MAYSLLTSAAGSAPLVTVGATTTPAISSVGADLLIVVAVSFEGSAIALSDNQSNFYTVIGPYSPGNFGYGVINIAIGYKVSPTTNASHTFSITAGNAAVIAASCWSGANTTGTHDQTSAGGNNNRASTTFTTGSITPSEDNELVILGTGFEGTDNPPFSVDGGFTIAQSVIGVTGTSYGLGLSYLIQTTAAAANPTITIPTSGNLGWGLQASFKGTGGGGGGNPWYAYAQQRQKVERTWNRNGLLWHPSYAMAGVN